jgi:hypothetical protein
MLLLLAPVERDSHPHGDLVVKVLTLPSVPEYCYSFRMNESHTIPFTRRQQSQTPSQQFLGGRRALGLLYNKHYSDLSIEKITEKVRI